MFALLAAWTGGRLTSELLPWALAFYLLHAAMHTAFPLLLERHRPAATPTWWSQLFPPLALLLMAGPLFKLDAVSLAFWPCVLLVDLLAIGLALVTASLTAVAIARAHARRHRRIGFSRTGDRCRHAFTAVGLSAVSRCFFFAAGIFLARRLGDRLTGRMGRRRRC